MRGHRLLPTSMRLLACLLIAACLAGCVYKIEVQQGNYVTKDVVDKLKLGMTKAEVRALLGTPLLNDVFHADQWDYYFSDVRGKVKREPTRLTLIFRNDKLYSFEGYANPPMPTPEHPLPPAPTVR